MPSYLRATAVAWVVCGLVIAGLFAHETWIRTEQIQVSSPHSQPTFKPGLQVAGPDPAVLQQIADLEAARVAEVERINREIADAVWIAEHPPVPVYELPTKYQAANPWGVSMEPCGGDLPPCWVKQRESGGDYAAVNPTGCGGRGCFGAWQFSGEWACKLGLPCDLASAAPDEQDNAARLLWNGGRGCANWSACA